MRKFALKTVMVAASVMMAGAGQVQAGAVSAEKLIASDSAVFGRTYSADYLKKHQEQKFQSFRFERFPKAQENGNQGSDVPGMEFSVSVKFRDSNKPYEAAGMCFPGEEGVDCRIDCDGSGFFLKADKDGSLLLVNTDGIQLNGCGEKDLKERVLKSSPDNEVIRLDPVPQG